MMIFKNEGANIANIMRSKAIPFILILVLTVNLLPGCATTGLDSWIGRHRDELLSEWGVPAQILSSDSGEIYAYESTKIDSSSHHYDYTDQTFTNYYVEVKTVMFWIDQQGIIYKYAESKRN